MTRRITEREFHLLRNFIEAVSGIALGRDKQYLVEARLSVLVNTSECGSFEELFQKANSPGGEELQSQIVDAIATSETSWFRDKPIWRAMRDHVLPRLLEKAKSDGGRAVRCWSAACSTGQEPYSLSMLADASLRDKPDSPGLEILASDVSNRALAAARAGVYDRILMGRGFDGSFERFRTDYFTEHGRTSTIDRPLRDRIRFERINLIDGLPVARQFDLILLRNVGIYFSDELKRSLFEKISDFLAPDGYLVLGSAESPLGYTRRFVSREIDRAIYYRLSK